MSFKRTNTFIAGLLAAIIFIAFFLPWVGVHSAPISGITKMLTGSQQPAAIRAISLYQVPILANGPDARLMISIIKIFNPDVKDADKKSWAVWGVPILAIFMAVVLFTLREKPWKKWLYLLFGIIGCGIFTVGIFKIKTTDLDKLVLQIVIGPGAWITLWAYFGIGLACMHSFILSLKKQI